MQDTSTLAIFPQVCNNRATNPDTKERDMENYSIPDLYQKVEATARQFRHFLHRREPKVALILGSGLGDFAGAHLTDARFRPYRGFKEIFETEVPGHAGNLCSGYLADRDVLVFQGRPGHYFELIPYWRLMLPVWAAVMAGVETVIITSAVGSLRASIAPGSFVLITDHLNHKNPCPMDSVRDSRFYPKNSPGFLPLGNLYHSDLRSLAHSTANALAVNCMDGVYAFNPGRAYETPAEVSMLKNLGGDVVGMSMIYEAMAAHSLGAKVLGIGFVTNLAAGLGGSNPNHEEVTQAAQKGKDDFARLLLGIVQALPQPAE